jgi:putative phage-type endonuclease
MIRQRSDKWHKQRLGRITASELSCVIAKPETKKYISYQEKIINGLLGIPDFDDGEKPWFNHGKEMEPEAISLYEWEKDTAVAEAGLCIHPKYDFIACSSDGEVGKDGLVEVKSRISLVEHLKSVRAGVDKKYLPQIQGCIWTTGREWCDFVSYYKSPQNPKTGQIKTLLHIHRVDIDKEYIAMLEKACLKFWKEIEDKLNNNNS